MDPIADFFTRIVNAYRARKAVTLVPFSGFKAELARVLESRGYVGPSEKKGRRIRKYLEIHLRYEGTRPAMRTARLISKRSRRRYAHAGDIRPVRQGSGLLIVSTSRGLMSGEEARKAHLGGELIAEVW